MFTIFNSFSFVLPGFWVCRPIGHQIDRSKISGINKKFTTYKAIINFVVFFFFFSLDHKTVWRGKKPVFPKLRKQAEWLLSFTIAKKHLTKLWNKLATLEHLKENCWFV